MRIIGGSRRDPSGRLAYLHLRVPPIERKLVSIQRVESLAPIASADNIVKARVMGWDRVSAADRLVAEDRLHTGFL